MADEDDPVVKTLSQIATLLEQHGLVEWAAAFSRFSEEYVANRPLTRSQVLSLYGGMGSFNDIVLQDSDGSMPAAANESLMQLRLHLHNLFMQQRYTQGEP